MRYTFFTLWVLLIGCSQWAGDIDIHITNLSPTQPIAVKLPNRCWFVLYPGNFTTVRISPLERTLLIAFAEADDVEAFKRAMREDYCDEDVNPPRTKLEHFEFDSRRKVSVFEADEETIAIVAEEIQADSLHKSEALLAHSPQGIATIKFRLVK